MAFDRPIVRDGDSLMYPNLGTGVLPWGHVIRKLEYANHAKKRYRSALEKLAQQSAHYRGKSRLTRNMWKRLTKAAQ